MSHLFVFYKRERQLIISDPYARIITLPEFYIDLENSFWPKMAISPLIQQKFLIPKKSLKVN